MSVPFSRCLSGIFSRYAPHFMLWGVLFAIGLLLAILGIVRPTAGTLLPGALFLFGSFACLIPMFIGLSRTPREAQATPDGLRWHANAGERQCRWDEIVAVYRLDKIINQTFRVKQLRVVLANDEEVTFDQTLSEYEQLANTVQATTTGQLMPAKRADLAGAGAAFGPITLHRDAITINGKTFSWSEIEQYTIVRGSMVVYPRSYQGLQCEELILSSVPNYIVMMQLLQEQGHTPLPPEQSILYTGRR